jgi:hypothetical protein
LTLEFELITGENGVPAGISTLLAEVGTPPHQLRELFQSELDAPTHAFSPITTVTV